MGRIAEVLSFERVTDEAGSHVADVKVDPGGGAIVTADHYAGAGDDAPPLTGDFVALEDSSGSGREQVSGYLDPKNAGTALPGEKRIYARNSSGAVVAEIWLKGAGSVTIENGSATIEIAANGDITMTGGTITLNGVEIDTAGNIVAPGEVTAMGTPGVKLSTHMHPTAMGPSGPPTPGT